MRDSEPVLRKLNALRARRGLPSCSKVALQVKPDYERVQALLEAGQRALGLQLYFDAVMTLCPPLLHQWLLLDFPDPRRWLRARERFTQTTAVWAMTGYISSSPRAPP